MIPFIIGGVVVAYMANKIIDKDEQIEQLQEDNLNLKKEIKKLQEMYKDILGKYEELKIWIFKEKILKTGNNDDRKIFRLWVLDEYLEVSKKKINNEKLNSEEERFLNIIEIALENNFTSDEDKEFLERYIRDKHFEDIKFAIEPDINLKLKELEVVIKSKEHVKL